LQAAHQRVAIHGNNAERRQHGGILAQAIGGAVVTRRAKTIIQQRFDSGLVTGFKRQDVDQGNRLSAGDTGKDEQALHR
jgi:hypothetical protein